MSMCFESPHRISERCHHVSLPENAVILAFLAEIVKPESYDGFIQQLFGLSGLKIVW